MNPEKVYRYKCAGCGWQQVYSPGDKVGPPFWPVCVRCGARNRIWSKKSGPEPGDTTPLPTQWSSEHPGLYALTLSVIGGITSIAVLKLITVLFG